MDYNYQSSGSYHNGEPDYYEMYTQQQLKTAKSVFSRYHISLFAYIVVSYAATIAVNIALLLAFGSDGMIEFLEKNRYVNLLLSFAPMYLVGFPVFFLIIKNMKTMPRKKSKMKISEFLSFFLISEFVISIGNVIGEMLNSFFGIIKGDEIIDYTNELINSMPIWLTLIIVVVVGPIVEELIFRKFMIDRLSRYGSVVAIIVSSVSFGFFHGNFYQFFYAVLVGLVFGFIYAKTGNVIYSIAMHILVNFFGTLIPMLLLDRMNEYIDMLGSLQLGIEIDVSRFFQNLMIIGSYNVIHYAIMITGAIFLYNFIKYKKYKFNDAWEYKLPRERAASVIIMNAGSIAFLTISLILFAFSIIM